MKTFLSKESLGVSVVADYSDKRFLNFTIEHLRDNKKVQ